MAGATGAEYRVRSGAEVRREDRGPDGARIREIVVQRERVEIGMIQDVKEFAAKLHFESLVELPNFGNREVPFPETRPPKDVAPRVAESSGCGSGDRGTSGDVASAAGAGKARLTVTGEVGISVELISGGLTTRCQSPSYALLRLRGGAADDVLIGVGVEIRRVDVVNRRDRRPMNVARRSGDIPSILEFTGKADIIAEIVKRVGFAGLEGYDARDLPALQHL